MEARLAANEKKVVSALRVKQESKARTPDRGSNFTRWHTCAREYGCVICG